MPTYKMRAPNGRVYRITGPAGATEAQIRAAILRQFPDAGKPAPKPKPKPKAPPSRAKAFGAGVVSGFENVSNTIVGIAGDLVDKFDVTPAQAVGWAAENLSGYSPAEARQIAKNLSGLPGFGDIVRAGAEKRQGRFAETQAARPYTFTAGKITGEVVGTAPIISVAGAGTAAAGAKIARAGGQMAARGATGGRAVQKAGRIVEAGGRAVRTGGVGVRAPTRAAVAARAPIAATRAGRLGLRVLGGGAAGVLAAELTDQDIVDAALAGSIIPIVGTIARRGAGFVYDALRRRLGEVRAADIMRNLIASNSSEITMALRGAPDDARANTAEFLASQGLLTPELAAATRMASASAEGAPLEQVARARAAGQEEMRTVLRGGATGTEAMQNIAAARREVAEVTDPMREEALRLSDVGRTQIVPAEREAERLRAAAADEVDRARRLLMASDDEAMRLAQMDDLGDPLDMAAINRQRSLQLGAAARSAEEVAANLRAQGLQPLNIGAVVSDLRRKAADAEFVNPPRFRVLTEFANNLERRAASQGGVIDATGLYELRKSMADTVADLLGPMDPGALQRRTAELVGDAKPLIDDAIKAAGGTGWRQYLDTFASGMQRVEQQQFARVLEKLPEARLVQVMAGNDPDFVAKFFGPGRYDVNVELFGSRLPVAQKLAGEIDATRAVAATGQKALAPSQKLGFRSGAQARVNEAFQPGMKNVFARGLSRVLGGIPGVYGGSVAADQMAREVSQQISQNAMRELVPGLVSPQAAASMLGVRSSSNKIAQIVNSLSPSQRAVLGQALTQGTMGAVRPVPAAPALPAVDLPGGDGIEIRLSDYDEYGNYIGPR